MTTITAPSGLVNLLAPIPQPPSFDLLAAATLIPPTNNRWLGGGWTGGDAPGPAFTFDPCSSGTNRVKEPGGRIATQMNGTFVVYQPAFCTASTFGPDPQWAFDRLELVFQAFEGAAIERMLATGDNGQTILGPYLGDPNMEILGSGAVSPRLALQLLETAVALHANGMIHAAPATFTAWAADFLVVPKGNVMRTQRGTPVAVGPGYIGATPNGQSAPADNTEWAFASSPIEIYREQTIKIIPGNYAEMLDRSNNDVSFIAERSYLFNWIGRQASDDADHTQAGVLVDLDPCICTGT